MSKRIELIKPDLPEFGLPQQEPIVPPSEYEKRIDNCRAKMAERGLQFLIVYGDREHFSNLEFLTGFDPRFEESILILPNKDTPTLVVGLECMGYSQLSPIKLERKLWQGFSLLGMPRNQVRPLEEILREAGIAPGMNGGIAGWKYYSIDEFPKPESVFETPHFIIDTVKKVIGSGKMVNATELFMHPLNGLRSTNSVDQLAKFEFAASYASQAVRNVLLNLSTGISEYDASQMFHLPAMPLSCHLMLSAGPRAFFGLPSPSDRKITRGDPFTIAAGLRGGLTARAGFVVHSAAELGPDNRDYVDRLVKPYFAAIAEWYETIGIGVPGGELYNVIHRNIGDPFFGVTLTPGHLIHTDEWVNSPTFKDSKYQLKSGMAIQVDVIPGTGTPYYTTNLEDTIVLADDKAQEELSSSYPDAWKRIQMRREFIIEELNIHIKKEVLPFSNLPVFSPPYLLDPSLSPAVV